MNWLSSASRYTVCAAAFLIVPMDCAAQSPPYVSDVQNSASYSRKIAQGSLFIVAGGNLGPLVLVQATTFPLGVDLGGTSVKVTIGSGVFPCPMVYSSAGQIAAILPSNTPIGEGTVTVTYKGSASFPGAIHVVKSTFGVYSVASSGLGPGILTGANYITKTFSKPSKPGEVLIVWGTGLGAVAGADTNASGAGKQFTGVEIFVGDRAATVLYAGRSGCCTGVDQISFSVPDGVLLSCFLPVSIRTPEGASNFVSVAVSRAGEACDNAAPGFPIDVVSRIVNGEQLTVGMIGIGPIPVLRGVGFVFDSSIANQLSRMLKVKVPEKDVAKLIHAYRTKNKAGIREVMAKYEKPLKAANAKTRNLIREAVSGDQQGAAAKFSKSTGFAVGAPQFAANFPAAGTCTVAEYLPQDPTTKARALDAGAALTVEGPSGRRTMTRTSNGQYQAMLGSVGLDHSTAPGFYTVSGTGGPDVGAFSASVNVTSPLVWTNKAAASSVDRTRPMTVTWTGGPASGHVWIGGGARSADGSLAFTCTEEARKGAFVIPDFILRVMPEGTNGTMFVSPHPFGGRVQIPGLDLAFLGDASSDSRTVAFR